jgi:hypothetical protein
MSRTSFTRIAAGVIAACGLSVLVAGINEHGDNVQRRLANGLAQVSRSAPSAPKPVREARGLEFGEAGAGLDLVDMYQCMCGGISGDISGWVGLWLLTLLIGGVPTAVIVRSNRQAPQARWAPQAG